MTRRRLGRFAAGVLAFLFLCFSFQLLFFRTPALSEFLELAFGGKIHARYRSAWSLWPGSVHVEGLFLSGEDDNVQWELQIEEASFHVSLLDLFHKQFHATRVRARDVLWALRFKQLLLDVTPETIFGVPQITGYGTLALKPYGPDPLDTDATYHLWTVHLDDVDAREVHEIWIEKLHLIGTAHITGGFFLKPIREVRVMAQLEARPLELLVGDDLVAGALRGHTAFTLLPLDPRAGGAVSKIDLDASLGGQLGDLAFLRRVIPKNLELSAEPGPLRLDVQIEQGVLRPASRAELSTPHLHAARAPFVADAAARVSLQAGADSAGRGRGTLGAELRDLTVAIRHAGTAPLHAKQIDFSLFTNQLDLARPRSSSGFEAEVDDARIPDLALLEELVPEGSKLKVEGGSAELHGKLDSRGDRSAGGLLFSAKGARLSGAGVQLRADASGEIHLGGESAADGPVDLSGSRLSIDRASVTGVSGREWWGRFEFPKASFELASKSVSAQLEARCLDARPLRALFAVEGVPRFVATFFTMQNLQIRAGLRAAPGLLRLSDLDAHGDGASIRADYEERGKTRRGEALIRLGVAKAGLDLDGGKTHVKLIDATGWFDDRVESEKKARARGESIQR